MGLSSLIVGAITISILHAHTPSHWLTFVLVGGAQGWSRGRVMRLAILAGGGHVAMTTILGLAAAIIAKWILPYIGFLEAYLTSGTLIALGLTFLLLGLIKRGEQEHGVIPPDRATAAALFLMLTFSPCEAIIPLFFAASPLEWGVLITLSIVVMVSHLGCMLTLTYLALLGYERIHPLWPERHEKVVIGAVLMALGLADILLGR